MPFRSQAQKRWMFAAEARGELKKGTAKKWAEHTKNVKDLPERVKKADQEEPDEHPDLPQYTDPAAAPWTKGFAKAAAPIAGVMRGPKLLAKAMQSQSLAGSTDSALHRYNQGVMRKMVSSGNPIKEIIKPKGDTLIQGFKKQAENLPEKAHEQSNWNMGDYVPGQEARENMSTGQFKGISKRTKGVINEDREMDARYKRKADTARGGKHYGGTIHEGF